MTTVTYAANIVDAKQVRIALRFYRAALTLGILPMLMGLLILLVYWLTYHGLLVFGGFIMLPIGSGMVILGLAFLAVWAIMERKIARSANRSFRHKKCWLTALLLLSNFGVGAACAYTGLYIFDRTVVEIINETGAPIDACTIKWSATHSTSVGAIPGGDHIRRAATLKMDSTIALDLEQGPAHVRNDIAYVSGRGVRVRVHVRPGLITDVQYLK